MTAVSEDRARTEALRVLVAVHGYEPSGWAREACRLLSRWDGACVRVLAALDVPNPPFTSLTGPARAAFDAARAQWAATERLRLQPAIDALLPALPGRPELDHVPGRGDLARAIAEAARAWSADVVVVGPPSAGRPAWLRPGGVPARLLARAGCSVLVVAPPIDAGHAARDGRVLAAVPRFARAGLGG
jgi:nucleotide-binding universal stress UspA family protein